MLSWTYVWLGEHDKATQLGKETLTAARRYLRPGSQIPVLALYGMGFIGINGGDLDQAEGWFREALETSKRTLGPDHFLTWNSMSMLGYVYMLQGRYREAERTLLESVTNERRILGSRHWRAVQSLQSLVRLYAAWAKPHEAAKWMASIESTISPGSCAYDQTIDTYTVVDSMNSGIGLTDVFDEFHFAHKTLHGDGTLTARIDAVDHLDCLTEVGIMVRNTLAPTSKHASLLIVPTGTVVFRHRGNDRGRAHSMAQRVRDLTFPHWLRLAREKNTFTAQHSSDGETWEDISSRDPNQPHAVEIAMNETVHIGLAVTSWYPNRTTEVQFADVSFTGSVSPEGPFTASGDIALASMLIRAEEE
jgi:hypothetical protein